MAHFLGLTNLSEGRIIDQDRVASAWGEIRADTREYVAGDRVSVLILPEAARLTAASRASGGGNTVRGRLTARSFRGGRYQVKVQPDEGPPLTLELAAVDALPLRPGDQVMVLLVPTGVVLLPAAD